MTAIAADLVDERPDGFRGLTLSAVAARAGVAVPSLYKHVGSLRELQRAVALVAVQELAERSTAAVAERSGPEALRALAHAVRDYAHEHPGRYAASQVAPGRDDPADGPLAAAAARLVDVVGAVLRDLGLPEVALVPGVRAVRSAVHGFVDLELGGGFGLPEHLDDSFDVLLDVLVTGLPR